MLRNIKILAALLFLNTTALAQTISPPTCNISGGTITCPGGSLTPGGGGTPGGSNTQVQFNDSGAFGGSSLFTFNKNTGNISINNYTASTTITTSAAGTTTLTASSSRNQVLTGSSNQTYQLPDATTLTLGPWFVFNNNSSGSLVINNAGGSAQYTVPAGGVVVSGPTSISTSNGAWDFHPLAPATVTWGSGATGLVLNSALNTTPSITAGTPSSTSPVFIPRRDALTTGIGAQAAGNLSLIASGVETVRVTSTGFKIGAGSEITSSGAGGALAASAFTDTTNASNISSGSLAQARGGTGGTTPQTAMAALKGVYVLGASAVQVTHTGDTTEFTLATITVPANAMGANGQLRITTEYSYTGGTGAWTPRIKFNGTSFIDIAQGTTALSGRFQTFIANRNATNSQVGTSTAQANWNGSTAAAVTTAFDTTTALNITLTGQLANAADTVKLESYLVELIVP